MPIIGFASTGRILLVTPDYKSLNSSTGAFKKWQQQRQPKQALLCCCTNIIVRPKRYWNFQNKTEYVNQSFFKSNPTSLKTLLSVIPKRVLCVMEFPTYRTSCFYLKSQVVGRTGNDIYIIIAVCGITEHFAFPFVFMLQCLWSQFRLELIFCQVVCRKDQ